MRNKLEEVKAEKPCEISGVEKNRDIKDIVFDCIINDIKKTIPIGMSEQNKNIAKYFIALGIACRLTLDSQMKKRAGKDAFSQPFVSEFISLRIDKRKASTLESLAFRKILENRGTLFLIDAVIFEYLKNARIECEKDLDRSPIIDNDRFFVYGLITCHDNLKDWIDFTEKVKNKIKDKEV